MSKIKEFAEQVSVEMGEDGELTPDILTEASTRLNKKTKSHKERLVENPFEEEKMIFRSDGRVELCCYHGVGHISKTLTEYMQGTFEGFDIIHGCCGCCNHKSFAALENKLLKTLDEQTK